MELKVVELFAGVGGFRVGLNKINEFDATTGRAIENGNWEFVWANQFEPSTKSQPAYNCYTTRFGAEHTSNKDIHEVDKAIEIPEHTLLVGGFPCQDYSVARSLSNEKGIEGKKGVLFWDIRDIVEAKRPPFVLLENVDRLLKSPASMRGRDFAIMLKTFDDSGYNVMWRVINAGDYGMPQKRRRVFIFAFKKDIKYAHNLENKSNLFNDLFPIIDEIKKIEVTDINEYEDVLTVSNEYTGGKFLTSGSMINGVARHFDVKAAVEKLYTLERLLDDASEHNEVDKTAFIVENDKLDKWKYLKGGKRIERTSKTGHKYIYSEGGMAFPDKMEEPARTMLTSESTVNRSSHIILEDGKYRTLTPIEAEMIQMFPPNWTNTMTNRQRFFMMGNALVTGIVSRLEPKLKAIIEAE